MARPTHGGSRVGQHLYPARASKTPHASLQIALALVLSALLLSCSHQSKPYGGYSLADLRALPEEHLFYPGSDTLGHLGDEASGGPVKPHAASSGYVLGAQAAPGDIEAFYDRELQGRGWGPKLPVGGATDEVRTVGWRKGALFFRFAVLRPGDPRNPVGAERYTSVYTIVVIVIP